MSDPSPLDNTPRMRRIFQTVCDLRRNAFEGCRVLDLGCAHGIYAMEFARRGAHAVGIEGREEWIRQANRHKVDGGERKVEFIHGDVRDLGREKHGSFDIVLCLGLLYHLDADDLIRMLQSIHEVCVDFAVIDTQIAVRPDQQRSVAGHTYSGWAYREHEANADRTTKDATLGASLDDEFSYWLSRPSLFNALRHVGFTSVMEVRNPLDNMYAHGEFKLHDDVVTLVAMKGTPVGGFLGARADCPGEQDWPEDATPFLLKRPWSQG